MPAFATLAVADVAAVAAWYELALGFTTVFAGTRDRRVTDPAGHRLVFTGLNPNPDPEQQVRIKGMFESGAR